MVDEQTLMKAVKGLREKIGWNQGTFGMKIGKSYATVQNYEQGGRIPPTELWVFVALAREHGIDEFAELFKRAILENLPQELIAIIREPANAAAPAKTSETGPIHKGRVRA